MARNPFGRRNGEQKRGGSPEGAGEELEARDPTISRGKHLRTRGFLLKGAGIMQPADEYSCVFVTTPNITVARKLAAAAVGERLAACANLIPRIESHYWWKGQIESSSEVLVLFKTTTKLVGELEACVLKNHPYDTPEFLTFRLDRGNERYLAWLRESTKNDGVAPEL